MFDEKSVGAIIFKRNGIIKYLILHYPMGHWGFVKGHVENDESEDATLRREVEEETGIKDLKIIEGFREEISYFYKNEGKLLHKHVVFYLAETKTENVKLSYEHDNFKWLPYREVLNILTYKNSKELLKKAHKHINNSLMKFG